MFIIQLMENKSPGSGGGGGLSYITSSSAPLMNIGENNKLGGTVMNGGSPDSTTPKENSVSREDMQRSAPSPAASVDNHGGGGSAPNMYSLKWNTQLLSLQRSLANLWDSGIGTDAVLLCQGTPLPVHKSTISILLYYIIVIITNYCYPFIITVVLTAASPYVAAVVQVRDCF